MGLLADSSASSLVSIKAIWRTSDRGVEWPMRLLIGAVLVFSGYLVTVLPWIFVAGYWMRVTRLAIEGNPLELPPWNDWAPWSGMACG